MNAQELRIGNVIHYEAEDDNNQPVKYINVVDGEDICLMSGAYAEMHSPIPLTDQWLIDFGFTQNGGAGWKSPHSDLHFYWSLRNGFCPRFYETNTTDADKVIGVQYVHQLQNLYFALTGEELELKKK